MYAEPNAEHSPPRIERRLPIYIVADCSGGMLRYIPAVHSAVNKIVDVLKEDQRGPMTADISLITFNDDATRLPLTPLMNFRVPQLEALGKTQLGRALKALNAALDTDLLPQRALPDGAATLGFFRPLAFLITDGDPSQPEKEPWRPQASLLRQRVVHRPLHIVGLAVGANPKLEALREIADEVVLVTPDLERLKEELRRYITWIPEPA